MIQTLQVFEIQNDAPNLPPFQIPDLDFQNQKVNLGQTRPSGAIRFLSQLPTIQTKLSWLKMAKLWL